MNGKMLARYITLLALSIQCCYGRYIMYLTGQHDIVPESPLVSDLTHVILAFMKSEIFNEESQSTWPLFTTVEKVRSRFPPATAVMVAIGGWGDTAGFDTAARNVHTRKLFARNVKKMVAATGADGVDIDWEYPGGNGEDYKQIPNRKKTWEIDAYPLLLAEIRSALGPKKLISAAIPGLPRDMLAFTEDTMPSISASVDFFNVMTYDLMNRRDNVTRHHTGIDASLTSISTYEQRGMPLEKMNLGFAFYIKWFKTDPDGGCDRNPIGCRTVLMEDPVTGADLGQSGAFSWHDAVPAELSRSYARAMTYGTYDDMLGGHYYWDSEASIWWTWDDPEAIWKKLPAILERKKLSGAFAWGLGEDAPEFMHLQALTANMKALKERGRRGQNATWAPDLVFSNADALKRSYEADT